MLSFFDEAIDYNYEDANDLFPLHLFDDNNTNYDNNEYNTNIFHFYGNHENGMENNNNILYQIENVNEINNTNHINNNNINNINDNNNSNNNNINSINNNNNNNNSNSNNNNNNSININNNNNRTNNNNSTNSNNNNINFNNNNNNANSNNDNNVSINNRPNDTFDFNFSEPLFSRNRRRRKEIKSRLTKIKFNKSLNKGEDCCIICLGEFKNNQSIYKLSCSHIFHIRCLNKEIKYRKKCPMCRKKF